MKKVIRLTESDLTRIVKRVIMEQTSSMVDDVKKFCKDNGFTEDGDWITKSNNKFNITISFIFPDNISDAKYHKTLLCVSNKTSSPIKCDVLKINFNESNWNLSTFESTVKKYMV
jgi:hypothetical protein